MGKIRVKTLGDESLEEMEKNEAKKRQETKKMSKVPGLKGGEKIVSVGPSEEELAALEEKEQTKTEAAEENVPAKEEKKEKKAKFQNNKDPRSEKYISLKAKVDQNKIYSLNEALKLLEALQRSSFDESVELHLNTNSTGISGQVTLPHGNGKKVKVAVADDKLIEEIEKGVINFDVLVAEPQMMPKLAKVARILGPKGLMPNPKNGTVTANPQEVAKKYEGGQVNYKTEAKNPIIHLMIGKISFGNEKLEENINTALSAIKKSNIKNATLKSTMSPGLKIKI